MPIIATRNDANQLMLEGAMALSKVQSNGMRIDLDYCHRATKEIQKEMKDLESSLAKEEEGKLLKKKFGSAYKLKSDPQLAWLLFEHMKLTSTKKTKGGKDSVDAEALEEIIEDIDSKFLQDLALYKKLDKAQGTYLKNIIIETNDDGFLRPFFHLHTTDSYRSSSANINFQNIPVRDPRIKKITRSAFIPRENRQIGEIDFKGIEVSVSCCYHKDPTMAEYLCDPSKDMHRDMAQQLYILNEKEWNKQSRQAAKNKFVFPEFYGSYYKQVAPDLWKYVRLNGVNIGKDNKGISIIEHLRKKGIRDYDSFEEHVREIEDDFWFNRFSIYSEWKMQWWEDYNRKGYFDSLSGFRYDSLLKKNQVINLAVQGSAFHCLLRTLILLNAWLEKEGMETLIVGQIHDSMVLDIVPEELDDVMTKCQLIIKEELPKYYPWLYLPMTIEAELAPINEPWLNKKEIDITKYI